MPALDECHPQGVRALEKEGWAVSPFPYLIRPKGRKYPLLADIFAERNENEILIVEVKCFTNEVVTELYTAIGQYLIYRSIIQQTNPQLSIYLAIPSKAFHGIVKEIGFLVLQEHQIQVIVVNLEDEIIEQWFN